MMLLAGQGKLTKWEEFKPEVEDAVDEHGVYVDKQDDGVHTGQFEVIDRLIRDIQQDTARLCILRPVLVLIAELVTMKLETECSAMQDVCR